MAFTEDLTTFFNPDDFGIAATVGGSEVNGILDKEYVEIETGGVSVTGFKPVFTCATADVSAVTVGTAVVAEGVNYTVAAPPQPDGTGVTKLILQKT